MYLAIYRSKKTSEITNVHTIENEIIGELDSRTRCHNESENNPTTVEVIGFADNSLEVFLFNRYINIANDYKEELDNIAYAFDNLADKMHYFNEQRESEKRQ